jgi:GNAT superfamily N-acetyltransferase
MNSDCELIVTKKVEDFIPLFRGIPELGDPVFLSMLHWCGVGKRATELKSWRVYVVRCRDCNVGVSGLYQRPETVSSEIWLGWFGVVAEKRRTGLATWCLQATEKEARRLRATRLLVYCDRTAAGVHRFYTTNRFELIGNADEHFPGATATDKDLIFGKRLAD